MSQQNDFMALYNDLPRVKQNLVRFVVQTFWEEQRNNKKQGEKK